MDLTPAQLAAVRRYALALRESMAALHEYQRASLNHGDQVERLDGERNRLAVQLDEARSHLDTLLRTSTPGDE